MRIRALIPVTQLPVKRHYMPRPISWLPRLHRIQQQVRDSVRSHYERKDLEILFELQPRAAQLLLELLPTLAIGRSRLVERAALEAFLTAIQAAEDPSLVIEVLRREKPTQSRKRPRTLIQRDLSPVPLDALPANLSLRRGRLEISFNTVEELAETLYTLARAIETDGDQFARQYEVERQWAEPDPDEICSLFNELDKMETDATKLR